eukprot:8129743-Ditylum_brightwellii.AAC.1
MSDCEAHRMNTISSSTSVWKCDCGIAADAIEIIDKMTLNEQYFSLCEYTGPGTLEGLAGSAGWINSNND